MKRLKKVLKWTAIVVVGIVAILLIINAVLVSTTSSRLEKQIAAIREAGDPVCLPDLARDPIPAAAIREAGDPSLTNLAPDAIPADQDAAVFLRRAKEGIEAIDRELAGVHRSECYDESLLKEEEFSTIQAAFGAHPDVLPLLQQAAACPNYDPNIDYTVDPMQFLFDVSSGFDLASPIWRILWARVQLLVWQGKREDALQTCFTLSRLARHFERHPMGVGYVVSCACHWIAINCANQVLQSGPLSREARDALEAELALYDVVEPYRQMLKEERALGMAIYRTLADRDYWVNRARWNRDQSFFLQTFDVYLSLVSRPYSEFQAAQTRLETQSVPTRAHFPLPKDGFRKSFDRTRAKVRCFRTLNAVQRLSEHGDIAEPKLSDLGLPAEITIDPYNGKPLQMKKLPEGWMVYSVGTNLRDDGGKLDLITDIGFGPHPVARPAEEK